MAGIKDAVNTLKTVEGTLTNNKVANFCYTDTAYTNNQANGVSDYDYEREQNIPVASTEVLKTNETVFLKGFRSQASSITRMLINHFFGRVSYNLNKTADVLNGLLTNLYSYLGTANGIATLDANGRVPASQLPETAMEFKGTWNCATNTTSTSINLINGQGTKGDLYLCSVEGWFNASTGTGSATKPSPDTGYVQYFVNDRIVYDGSTWNRLSSGDIQRVNGLSPTDGNVQITRRVTQAQYNALTSAEKEGHIFIITDVNMNDLYVINDVATASDSVWSSQKTSTAISEALTNLQQTATSQEYPEDAVTNNINTWLPNDNTSKIVNLVCRGREYQLLCNKINTNNWNCLVNGNDITWKIEYVNGTRTVLEIATNSSIGRFISKYQITENNTVETTIDCNSGESQNYGFLALINYHSSSGDATTFDLRMIRTGYSGNYVSEQRIGIMNATGDQDDLTFIAQNNKIAIKNNSGTKRFDVTIIGFN